MHILTGNKHILQTTYLDMTIPGTQCGV